MWSNDFVSVAMFFGVGLVMTDYFLFGNKGVFLGNMPYIDDIYKTLSLKVFPSIVLSIHFFCDYYYQLFFLFFIPTTFYLVMNTFPVG